MPDLETVKAPDNPERLEPTGPALRFEELEVRDNGATLSVVPVAEGVAAPVPEPADPTTAIGTDPPRGKARSAQDRIDLLTKRWRDEERNRSGLETQIEKLMEVVRQQNTAISQLHRASPPIAADPLQGLAETPATTTKEFGLEDIQRVVTGAIENYDTKVREKNTAAYQLQEAQTRSLNAALEEFPELQDQRTSAAKHFSHLLVTSPLRALPDAPYQIALQVRGLLADEVGRAGNQAPRKVQASVVVPSPTVSEVPEIAKAEVEKAYQEASLAIRRGDSSHDTYVKWRTSRDMLARAKR